jgi:hypothetical protein
MCHVHLRRPRVKTMVVGVPLCDTMSCLKECVQHSQTFLDMIPIVLCSLSFKAIGCFGERIPREDHLPYISDPFAHGVHDDTVFNEYYSTLHMVKLPMRWLLPAEPTLSNQAEVVPFSNDIGEPSRHNGLLYGIANESPCMPDFINGSFELSMRMAPITILARVGSKGRKARP